MDTGVDKKMQIEKDNKDHDLLTFGLMNLALEKIKAHPVAKMIFEVGFKEAVSQEESKSINESTVHLKKQVCGVDKGGVMRVGEKSKAGPEVEMKNVEPDVEKVVSESGEDGGIVDSVKVEPKEEPGLEEQVPESGEDGYTHAGVKVEPKEEPGLEEQVPESGEDGYIRAGVKVEPKEEPGLEKQVSESDEEKNILTDVKIEPGMKKIKEEVQSSEDVQPNLKKRIYETNEGGGVIDIIKKLKVDQRLKVKERLIFDNGAAFKDITTEFDDEGNLRVNLKDTETEDAKSEDAKSEDEMEEIDEEEQLYLQQRLQRITSRISAGGNLCVVMDIQGNFNTDDEEGDTRVVKESKVGPEAEMEGAVGNAKDVEPGKEADAMDVEMEESKVKVDNIEMGGERYGNIVADGNDVAAPDQERPDTPESMDSAIGISNGVDDD